MILNVRQDEIVDASLTWMKVPPFWYRHVYLHFINWIRISSKGKNEYSMRLTGELVFTAAYHFSAQPQRILAAPNHMAKYALPIPRNLFTTAQPEFFLAAPSPKVSLPALQDYRISMQHLTSEPNFVVSSESATPSTTMKNQASHKPPRYPSSSAWSEKALCLQAGTMFVESECSPYCGWKYIRMPANIAA